MNCNQIREHLLDLMGGEPGPGELRDHLNACASCAAELNSMRRTMALLDQWQAPADTGPYFVTRLRARVREEQARPAAGWLAWFRKPALAATMMVLLVASISMFQGSWQVKDNSAGRTVLLKPGTAVGDLQYLDRNHDLLADFDLLDDVDNTPDTVQN